MSKFAWDPVRFDVGVPAMNDEHRGIIEAMNRLAEASAQKQSKNALRALLGNLKRVTVQHFADEEAYMAGTGFPALDAHRRMHANLLVEIGKHVEAFEAGPGELGEKFFHFLRHWLSAHIQHIDRQYGPNQHMRSTGT